jgi:CDP-glucose 4,6-dehydratase
MEFYKNRKVFITGHTGFKGTWMCKVLLQLGADITGYSLIPKTEPNLYNILQLDENIKSVIGDIRDYEFLRKTIVEAKPEIVIHMAAQPLVIESYKNPVYTYQTNVLGTVHLLEAIRECNSVKSVLNITTDKVYKNMEREFGYYEEDILDGYDPYSNSKSCSELVTNSYKNSFLNGQNIAVSTARSGNVIGGGDFAENRIIPDCIRAVISEKTINIRNPHSIRPYQHVLEPVIAYLLIAKEQYNNHELAGAYNVGPKEADCITTKRLVEIFCEKWNGDIHVANQSIDGEHETNCLKLNCNKISSTLGWEPRWDINQAVDMTVKWTKSYLYKDDLNSVMDMQIREYLNQ